MSVRIGYQSAASSDLTTSLCQRCSVAFANDFCRHVLGRWENFPESVKLFNPSRTAHIIAEEGSEHKISELKNLQIGLEGATWLIDSTVTEIINIRSREPERISLPSQMYITNKLYTVISEVASLQDAVGQ
jgi:hypothetical protein